MSSGIYGAHNSPAGEIYRTTTRSEYVENDPQRRANRSLSGKIRNLFRKSSVPNSPHENVEYSPPKSSRERSTSPNSERTSSEAPHLRAPTISWPFGKKKSTREIATTASTPTRKKPKTKDNDKKKKYQAPSMEISGPVYDSEHQTSIRGQNFVPRTPEVQREDDGQNESFSSHETTTPTKGYHDYTIINNTKPSQQTIIPDVEVISSPSVTINRSRSPSLNNQRFINTSTEAIHRNNLKLPVADVETMHTSSQKSKISEFPSLSASEVLASKAPLLPENTFNISSASNIPTPSFNSNQWKGASTSSLNQHDARSTTSSSRDIDVPKLHTPVIPLGSTSSKKDRKSTHSPSYTDERYKLPPSINNMSPSNQSIASTYHSIPDAEVLQGDNLSSFGSTKPYPTRYPGLNAIVEHHMRPSPADFRGPQKRPTSNTYNEQQLRPTSNTYNEQQPRPTSNTYNEQQLRPTSGIYSEHQSRPTSTIYNEEQSRPTSNVYNEEQWRPTSSIYGEQQKRPTSAIYSEQQKRPTSAISNEQPSQYTTSPLTALRFDTSTATSDTFDRRQRPQPQQRPTVVTNGTSSVSSSIHQQDGFIRPLTPQKSSSPIIVYSDRNDFSDRSPPRPTSQYKPPPTSVHVDLSDYSNRSPSRPTSHYSPSKPQQMYHSSTTIYTKDKRNYTDGGVFPTWTTQDEESFDRSRRPTTPVSVEQKRSAPQVVPSKVTDDYRYISKSYEPQTNNYNRKSSDEDYQEESYDITYEYNRPQRRQQYSYDSQNYSNNLNSNNFINDSNSYYTRPPISNERGRIYDDQSSRLYKDNFRTQEPFDRNAPVEKNEEEIRHYSLQRSNSYDGLGILISSDAETGLNHRIRDVEPASPGYRSGLRKNDRIVNVNGVNVENVEFTDVLLLIKEGLNNNNLQFSVIKESKPF